MQRLNGWSAIAGCKMVCSLKWRRLRVAGMVISDSIKNALTAPTVT